MRNFHGDHGYRLDIKATEKRDGGRSPGNKY